MFNSSSGNICLFSNLIEWEFDKILLRQVLDDRWQLLCKVSFVAVQKVRQWHLIEPPNISFLAVLIEIYISLFNARIAIKSVIEWLSKWLKCHDSTLCISQKLFRNFSRSKMVFTKVFKNIKYKTYRRLYDSECCMKLIEALNYLEPCCMIWNPILIVENAPKCRLVNTGRSAQFLLRSMFYSHIYSSSDSFSIMFSLIMLVLSSISSSHFCSLCHFYLIRKFTK